MSPIAAAVSRSAVARTNEDGERNPPATAPSPISELNERSREIFRLIVDGYVADRRADRLAHAVAAARRRTCRRRRSATSWPIWKRRACSIRRIPRPGGCRPRPGCASSCTGCSKSAISPRTSGSNIESLCAARGKSLAQALEEATTALSGLSHCAGVVVVPKQDRPLKHIEFVHLGPGRALVVLVTEDGLVENRVIEVPLGLPPATLVSGRATTSMRGWSAAPSRRRAARSRTRSARTRRSSTS